jgi:hypothetical protein
MINTETQHKLRRPLNSMIAGYDLPTKPFCINEYASPPEQQPGGGGWYISRLERLYIMVFVATVRAVGNSTIILQISAWRRYFRL